MNNYSDGIIGILGIIINTTLIENINEWVGIICSIAIALATCFVQVYRIIRDKNVDKETDEDKEKEKEE